MKQKQLDKQPVLDNDHDYTGQFSDQQVNGKSFRGKKYVEVQKESLTDYQNFLYNRALFGLAVYSQEELRDMRWDKRKRIIKVHKRAQVVLNLWRQEIVNVLSTHLFESLFPNTIITEGFVSTKNDTDPEYINKMSFKALRISKAQIVSKLVAEGILPPNFYELKTEQLCK